jgi:Arc/MetJ-type ribon-helix-helix transcriptional regulator
MAMSFELEDLKIPDALKAWVRSQVASGRYATETDLFVEALTLLFETLREMERMLARLTPDLKLILISDAVRSIRQEGISDILTHDNHFTQEGFTILL